MTDRFPTVLVDTNVLSYVFRKDEIGARYSALLRGKYVCVSFITIGELHYGARKANWGERRMASLRKELDQVLVLPGNARVAETYTEVVFTRQSSGRPISTADALIAATAVAHQLPLITHNRRDFERIPGLTILSEGEVSKDA